MDSGMLGLILMVVFVIGIILIQRWITKSGKKESAAKDNDSQSKAKDG